MKRNLEDEPFKKIKICNSEDEEIRFYLKTVDCGISFNNTVNEFNKKYCIVNFCIDTDDDELLDLVTRRWSGFRKSFSATKCIWMKRITDNKSHRCYGYFRLFLDCNFLPDSYYNPVKIFSGEMYS